MNIEEKIKHLETELAKLKEEIKPKPDTIDIYMEPGYSMLDSGEWITEEPTEERRDYVESKIIIPLILAKCHAALYDGEWTPNRNDMAWNALRVKGKLVAYDNHYDQLTYMGAQPVFKTESDCQRAINTVNKLMGN